MCQSHCVSEDTGANDFAGYAKIRSNSLVTEGTMKEIVSILTWRAAVQNRRMTRDTVWNRPLSLGTPPSPSQRKTHLREWTRCRGNLMDSFGSFVAASRISAVRVGQNHQHSASYPLLWKTGIDRSRIIMQFLRRYSIQRGLLIHELSTDDKIQNGTYARLLI